MHGDHLNHGTTAALGHGEAGPNHQFAQNRGVLKTEPYIVSDLPFRICLTALFRMNTAKIVVVTLAASGLATFSNALLHALQDGEAQPSLVEVDVIYHSPLPVLSRDNDAGNGHSPKDCIVFNPAYIPANPPGLTSAGLLVRMCCGPSCTGHGTNVEDGGDSAERIGFAPCDLQTGACQDVLADFNLDPSVDAEDPRAFLYNDYYYNFYFRSEKLPGTDCAGDQCTVALAKTRTPLDAESWEPVATLPWHRNGCCVMREKGQKSFCMWGEGPGPFPGLGISYTTDIDSGNFTQVPWTVDDNSSSPISADDMWLLPLGADLQEVKLEAGTHVVELSNGNLFTFYAAATPGWVPNGNYTVALVFVLVPTCLWLSSILY